MTGWSIWILLAAIWMAVGAVAYNMIWTPIIRDAREYHHLLLLPAYLVMGPLGILQYYQCRHLLDRPKHGRKETR